MPTHTIAENLQRLVSAKSAIADAIVSKGGNVSAGDGFEAFPSAINALEVGGISLDPMEDPDDINKIISRTISGTYINSCINTLKYGAFAYCSSLVTVSFPKCQTINRLAFGYCTNLNEVYLLNDTICTLATSDAFTNTLIASGSGHIYVPSSLAAFYKTATNWTYYSNIIVGI